MPRPTTATVRSTANDAIVTFSEEGFIEAANPVAEGLLLYAPNELLGKRIFSLIPRECESWFMMAMDIRATNGSPQELSGPRPFRLLRKDGYSVAVDATIAPVRFEKRLLWTLLARDNSSRDRAVAQWERMERLAAIGQAASGIAHESRNSLQRIAAAVHQLKKTNCDGARLAECVGRIEVGLSELKRLHETVLEFVKPRVLQPVLSDLREVVQAAWKAATARPGLPEAEFHECPELHESLEFQDGGHVDTYCEVDAFAMRQVFRNIFENSLAASPVMPRIDVSYEELEPYGESGLRIVVRDNGPGLTEQQQKMIFEPFYTTKEHGLGLGMTIVRQVVESHGGEIELRDGPGAEIAITLRKELR